MLQYDFLVVFNGLKNAWCFLIQVTVGELLEECNIVLVNVDMVETEELAELYNCFPLPNASMHLHKRVQTEACILSTIHNVLLLHFACCLLIDRPNNSPPLLDHVS